MDSNSDVSAFLIAGGTMAKLRAREPRPPQFPRCYVLQGWSAGPEVSSKFNLFLKLRPGIRQLNPEKAYTSVYESFRPTSAPSFPPDYH